TPPTPTRFPYTTLFRSEGRHVTTPAAAEARTAPPRSWPRHRAGAPGRGAGKRAPGEKPTAAAGPAGRTATAPGSARPSRAATSKIGRASCRERGDEAGG